MQKDNDAVKVGVVVPTHNRPRLLRSAVRSILDQEVDCLRVSVVDEASEPPARTSLQDVADPRITVIRNEVPRGPGAARNQGASALESRYVGFLDDDDRWLPGKLAACLAAFERYPDAGMVVHGAAFHGGRTAGSGEVRLLTDPVRRMLVSQPPHVDTVLVRRAVHDAVRFDESFPAAADLDYMLRVAMAAPVVEIDAVLAMHGPPGDRISAISLERRVAARAQFRAKHAGLFNTEAAAFYDLRLGHLHRRAGQRGKSAVAFSRSLRRRPAMAGAWKGLLGLAVPGPVLERVARR